MKAVLRSAKPYWFYLICEDIKKIEVGKDMPKATDWNRIVELYCSKDMRSFNRIPKVYQDKYKPFLGKVGARFVCNMVDEYTFSNLEAEYRINDIDIAKTCLNHPELIGYGKGKPLYGWHISELKIYDKPKSIKEFRKPCPYLDLPCSYFPSCDSDENDNLIQCFNTVSRPPQSWCYVEELK